MLRKSKLMIVAAIAATAFAAPAFAQSADHTGSQLASFYDGNAKQTFGTWAPQVNQTRQVRQERQAREVRQTSGLYSFAATPAPVAQPGYDPSIESQR
jgi:Spy/CpxP family protein refolding chaperone